MMREAITGAWGAFALALAGYSWASGAEEIAPTPSAKVLTSECLTPTAPGLSPAAIKDYADENAGYQVLLAKDGKHPKTGIEMILERISVEASYGNTASISERDNSWVVDWDHSKWTYMFKVEVPLDMKQRWLREKSAATAVDERRREDELQGRSEFVGKILKLRVQLAKGDFLAAETAALALAARSLLFSEKCISVDWRPTMEIPKRLPEGQ